LIVFRAVVTCVVCVVVASVVFALTTSLLGAPITVTGSFCAAAALALSGAAVARRATSIQTAEPNKAKPVRRRVRLVILSEGAQVKRIFDEQPV
jgi:hypothetical protein